MNHLMLDIETLSRRPDGCIISVGFALFTDTDVLDSNGWAIYHDHWHGFLEPDTIKWWMKQPDEVRAFSFNGTYSDMSVALGLKTLADTNEIDEVWANDPNFDLSMLEQWWTRVGLNHWPFAYWKYRSFRTITALTKEVTGQDFKAASKNTFAAHNPVEDAVNQARVVIACRHALKREYV